MCPETGGRSTFLRDRGYRGLDCQDGGRSERHRSGRGSFGVGILGVGVVEWGDGRNGSQDGGRPERRRSVSVRGSFGAGDDRDREDSGWESVRAGDGRGGD